MSTTRSPESRSATFRARASGEAVLDPADHRERVGAGALQRDAGDRLALAVDLGDAAPLVRGELDAGDVAQQHRHALVALHHDLLQVGQALDVAAAADRELGLGELDGTAPDVTVAGTDRIADFRQRNPERLHRALGLARFMLGSAGGGPCRSSKSPRG